MEDGCCIQEVVNDLIHTGPLSRLRSTYNDARKLRQTRSALLKNPVSRTLGIRNASVDVSTIAIGTPSCQGLQFA